MLSSKEVRELLKYVTACARRRGFRIDDDAHGVIGLAVARALVKWSPDRATIQTFATRLAVRALQFRQSLQLVEFVDELYMKPPRARPYVAQELLLTFPEPDQTLGFAVWIARRPVCEVAAELNLERYKADQILERAAKKLRRLLDDV